MQGTVALPGTLRTYENVRHEQVSLPQLVSALKKCSQAGDLESGRKLHLHAVAASLHTNKYVAAVLITMYGKCGVMVLAREVFQGILQRDVVVWNSLILGYVTNGEHLTAINLFTVMDCKPSSFTYVAVLKACACLASEKPFCKGLCLEQGVAIHKLAEESGFDVVVGNSLLVMYSKCNSMSRAKYVFDKMSQRDVVTWNSLVLGYVENGQCLVALKVYAEMPCEADSFTYVAILKAFGSLAEEDASLKQPSLSKVIDIHDRITGQGLQTNVVVATTLLDMYSKCGDIDKAKNVFDRMVYKNVITWTSLILGYVENGQAMLAIDLFTSIDCEPDSFAYVAVLKACGSLAGESEYIRFCLEKGLAIHSKVNRSGLYRHVLVANALIAMYTKCGSMDRAVSFFYSMEVRDVVTWNTLLQGYLENDQSSAAVELFTSMELEPNSLTYVAALKACASIVAVKTGQEIHANVCRFGMEGDRTVSNMLLDFYVKSGCMSRVEVLFNSTQVQDVVSWNTFIAGYTSLKDASHVFYLVEQMKEAGVQLDSVTFVCILTACSHAGLLDEAKMYFSDMLRQGTGVGLEHYCCMVDLQCRTGKLTEALSLIDSMPFEASPVTWMTLLGACRKWKNVEVGRIAFDALVAAGLKDASAYVLMSDICGNGCSL